MTKKLTVFLMIALILVSCIGCSNPSEPTDSPDSTPSPGTDSPDTPNTDITKELTMGIIDNKVALDKTVVGALEPAFITEMVYEGLIYVDPLTGDYLPRLAESFEMSEDHLTITWHLRKGVKWHDGTDFTVNDVLYSYKRCLDPLVGSRFVTDFLRLVGASDFVDGKTTDIAGFKIVDDYTFTTTISEGYPWIVDSLGGMPIYPEKACSEAEASKQWGFSVMVGTGPYMLEELNTDTGCTLVVNPDYYGDIPKIDRLFFKYYTDRTTMMLEYEMGMLDTVTIDGATALTYKEKPEFADQVQVVPYASMNYLVFNTTMAPFDNDAVREAFAYGVDIEGITAVNNGQVDPANDFIHPMLRGHDANRPIQEYNPEKAKQILTDAGVTMPVKVELWVSGTESSTMLALQAGVNKAGFELELIQKEKQVLDAEAKEGKAQLQIYNNNVNSTECGGLIFNRTKTNTGSALWNGDPNGDFEHFSQVISESRVTFDIDKRTPLVRQAADILLENYWSVPLNYPKSYCMNRPYVQNLEYRYGRPKFLEADIDMAAKLEAAK